MGTIKIKVATEFSRTPGVREALEGDFPGDDFLKNLLLPKFQEALKQGVKLIIDMDGTAGYTTSFLEAAFGGLAREYKDADLIIKNIEIISTDDPFLKDDIIEYINEAN